MAIVTQTKRIKIRNLFGYVEDEIHAVNKDLKIEMLNNPEYDSTFRAGRDASAKDHAKNIVKAIRWLINDLGLSTPSAFTDAQIDALSREIREFDDED